MRCRVTSSYAKKYLKGRPVIKILNVDGVTCEHCVDTIKEAVEILDGVFSVDVDIEKKQVVVEFDEKMAKPENLIAKIEEVGFVVRM
jgi:copper chaperone